MMTANLCSRYDLVIAAIREAARTVSAVQLDAHAMISQYQHRIRDHTKYIEEHGRDPDGLYDRPSF